VVAGETVVAADLEFDIFEISWVNHVGLTLQSGVALPPFHEPGVSPGNRFRSATPCCRLEFAEDVFDFSTNRTLC
jgi:hypothetical protein